MKNLIKKAKNLSYSLAAFLTLFIHDTVSANLVDIVDKVEGGATTNHLGETKTKILNLSTEVTDIVVLLVMVSLLASGILTGLSFKGAAYDSNARSRLKKRLMLEIGAIVFCASYFGFVKFGLKNLKIFQ